MVTAAAIHCPPRPLSKNVTFLQCADFSKVLQTFQKARSELGEILSAFEFLDKESLDLSVRVHEDVSNPLQDDSERFYMVVETSGSNERHDNEKLENFLESAMESGIITNGAVAQDGSQFRAFWRIREGIPEALTTYKAMYKYVSKKQEWRSYYHSAASRFLSGSSAFSIFKKRKGRKKKQQLTLSFSRT